MSDLINRSDALIKCYELKEARRNWDNERGRGEMSGIDAAMCVLQSLPSAQPERLRDNDFEAIRIHLNAYKERLCNQYRYAEAEEYQQLIDRFMSFAEAQPERKRGKWGRTVARPALIVCNRCGRTVLKNGSVHWNFCPNCGADMRGDCMDAPAGAVQGG